jgi:hypothetical protein
MPSRPVTRRPPTDRLTKMPIITSVDPVTYKRLQGLAKRRGIELSEFIRATLEDRVATEQHE